MDTTKNTGEKQRDQEKIFREYPVWKAIFAMALPAMITMLVMILYNMADTFFISRLGDDSLVAAVSVVGPVFSIIMAVGSMLGGGSCVLIARTLGEGQKEDLRRYSSLSFWGSLLFGVIFTGIILAGQSPILSFLGSNEEFITPAREYLLVLALGAPFMVCSATMGNTIRATGAVKESMIGNLLGTAVNFGLDPLLILALGLGVKGAAIATVAGNALSVFYYVYMVQKKSPGLSISPKVALKRPSDLFKILSLGFPNLVSTGLSAISQTFSNRLLVAYGTSAVAAMAAAGKSTMIIAMIQMGLCIGVQPLLSYSHGAGDHARLGETLRKLLSLTVSMGTVLSLVIFFCRNGFIGLFLPTGDSFDLALTMIQIMLISGPFFGIFYVGSSYLQGTGKAALATLVSTLRQGVIFIPCLFIMNHFWGITGNVCANLAADVMSSVISGGIAMWVYRKSKKASCI